MNNYYIEIENLIKKNEINKKARIIAQNADTLDNYWNIGRLLVVAQGGKSRAKYGNGLIKEWSKEFTKKYGKGYDYTNLSRFRQFYLLFPNIGTVSQQLTWSHIQKIITIKNTNKRNYYINLCIKNNLSVRELRNEIKSNSYERLIDKPKHIEIIDNNIPTFKSDMKNPIIIELNKNENIKSESDLEMYILSRIQGVLSQLGKGYAVIGNQVKINNYYLDLLLFNIKFNCYVVVELKLRKLKKEDLGQVKMYMDLVDKNIKEVNQNKTKGIIISKEQDKLIVNFLEEYDIVTLTYKIINN